MSLREELDQRSGQKCELCQSVGSQGGLVVFQIPPILDEMGSLDESLLTCSTCNEEMNRTPLSENHWHCLNESMWSEYRPVQIITYRLLKQLNKNDLAEQIYFDDETRVRADIIFSENEEELKPTKDSNGNILQSGDSVSLIKNLDVKGANFTAKRGTIVRNISLTDNPEHIEGKVNGTQIVLLTCFLKKQ